MTTQLNDTIHRTRMSMNQSADALYKTNKPRVRRRTVTVDGESYPRYVFLRMVKAGRACGCGECIDCECTEAARKEGM